jgi:hypothetical protein
MLRFVLSPVGFKAKRISETVNHSVLIDLTLGLKLSSYSRDFTKIASSGESEGRNGKVLHMRKEILRSCYVSFTGL